MKIVGYHNTESDNVDDIIANGFVCKKNEKHWLGQGIYFFNDVGFILGSDPIKKK